MIVSRITAFWGACLTAGSLFVIGGCSLAVTRPVQEMADCSAAIKAAKEVGAETLAPELYRKANEAYFRAKNEYRMKQFDIAVEYVEKARKYAEEAEFEALRAGGHRNSLAPLEEPKPESSPYDYPTPTGTPQESMGNPPSAPTPAATEPPKAP